MRLPLALDYRPALLSSAGIGRATRELARTLAQRDDVGVHLFAHSLARARVAAAVPVGATLHRLPLPGRLLPALAWLGFGADRLAGSPRVFHWTDYVQAPLSAARSVLTVHDLAFVRNASWHGDNAQALRERTARAIAAAAAVFVPSQATAADVRAFAPGAAAVHVVPFGVDHVPPPVRRAPPHVLCLGTIEPRKNHLGLLAAWRLVPEPRPPLLVVGRAGWDCAPIVAALRGAAAAGELQWRERVADDELWPLLHGARLLVFPSHWEGFGFPPLEAMQAGIPVVANDCAALRELGDGAFLFADARDPAALAAAIDRGLRDENARADAVAAGRRRAADFRWQRCAAAHAAIYREVARC